MICRKRTWRRRRQTDIWLPMAVGALHSLCLPAVASGSPQATGPKTEFSYGASVVDVTTNAGQTWWQAFLGEQVLSVTFQNNRLIAIVQQQTTNQGLKAVTQVYVSKDGGRHWLYNDELGAL